MQLIRLLAFPGYGAAARSLENLLRFGIADCFDVDELCLKSGSVEPSLACCWQARERQAGHGLQKCAALEHLILIGSIWDFGYRHTDHSSDHMDLIRRLLWVQLRGDFLGPEDLALAAWSGFRQ